ncbi:MAG: lytic transglycosylase domain-containing protein [Methylophilus sp.]
MKKAILFCFLFSAFCVNAEDIYMDNTLQEVVISNTPMQGETVIKIVDDSAQYVGIESSKQLEQLPFNNEVVVAAKETALEPALIHAVIAVESNHNPKAASPKGAYGLMQLMPATAKRFNASNKKDFKMNILAGAQYLRELLTLFNGNVELTLAAYNAGPDAVRKYHNQIPPYLETRAYVPKVMKLYRKFSA